MITVQLRKFAGPKRHSVVRLFDGTNAAEVLVYPDTYVDGEKVSQPSEPLQNQ